MSEHYPNTAGWTEPDTSKAAADAIEASGKAPELRDEVLRVLALDAKSAANNVSWYREGEYSIAFRRDAGMTADELAAEMGESVFSVRPRVAELHKQGLIERTGERRPSSNGRPSHVWRLR